MSVEICTKCEKYVDTDYELGVYCDDKFICEDCNLIERKQE